MSGFEFNVDNEMARIRTPKKAGQGTPPAPKPEDKKPAPKAVSQDVPQAPGTREIKQPEPEGFGISQGHQESNNGSDVRVATDPVNWKKFKTLPGVFEYVGGDRPVLVNPLIKRVQVSGLPEQLMIAIQDTLREKYKGARVDFPWGTYEINERNRVFTTKASLLRYMMFDSLRDGHGLQVQYAKQWLVSQHAAFDVNFRPDVNLKPTHDELDIYALLIVSDGMESGNAPRASEGEHQTAEQLVMMNTGLRQVMERLNDQDKAFEAYAERSNMVQTVMLLDRMGLLKGGLPKDIGAFVRVLEQNRDGISGMGETVDDHLTAEDERERTIAREARLRSYQSR